MTEQDTATGSRTRAVLTATALNRGRRLGSGPGGLCWSLAGHGLLLLLVLVGGIVLPRTPAPDAAGDPRDAWIRGRGPRQRARARSAPPEPQRR